jgi:predicted dehydrogenase
VSTTEFAIVGSGWRADFYLRLAAALPEEFAVVGMVVRTTDKGEAYERRWGVTTYRTVDELLAAQRPAFAVTSVPWAANPGLIRELAGRGVPVLSETPPAPDLDGLAALYADVGRGAIVEIAEQYPFLPTYAARIGIARSGLLGPVTSAHISATQTYHAVALLRALLGVEFEDARITGVEFTNRLLEGPDRDGWPGEERLVDARQVIATLDFGDRLGLYDFTAGQWFHPLLGRRIVVRGERGEIVDDRLTYLRDAHTPVETAFRRQQTGLGGDLEGFFLRAIDAGERRAYTNPYAPARLPDEEIAIATCLTAMGARVEGGPSFYGLARASQDHYLGLMISQAVAQGRSVRTSVQPWASATGS